MKMNENGRSMVEMLGVLAIIGVLSAGGLAGYSKAMFKHKLNSTMDQITMLVTNIRTMYGTQGNYDGLSGTAAINLGIVPAVMGSTSAGLTNPFKGSVSIGVDTVNTVEKAGFHLTYAGLPAEACIALATSDFGSGAGSGFIAAKINSETASGTFGTATEGHAYEMSGDAGAIALCNKASTKNNNSITWSFY